MSTSPGIRSFGGNERSPEVPDSQGWPVHWQVSLPDLSSRLKYLIFSLYRLPAAHTCFNQLDLPAYEVRHGGKYPGNITHFHPFQTYDKLRSYLLKAIQECSEGFGFAWGLRSQQEIRNLPTIPDSTDFVEIKKTCVIFWLIKWFLLSGPAEVTKLCQLFITSKAFV